MTTTTTTTTTTALRFVRASELTAGDATRRRAVLAGHVGWGGWRYDPAALTLTLHSDRGWYQVDVEDCIDSAHVLDWLAQFSGKTWASVADVGDLLRALDELLGFQAHLCPCGVDRHVAPRRLLGCAPDPGKATPTRRPGDGEVRVELARLMRASEALTAAGTPADNYAQVFIFGAGTALGWVQGEDGAVPPLDFWHWLARGMVARSSDA